MALPILTALLLVMAMLTGGGSQDRGQGRGGDVLPEGVASLAGAAAGAGGS